MKYTQYTLDSPEVVAILCGLSRSGKQSYYRIIGGKHVAIAARKQLLALGMCNKSASALLQAAPLLCSPFIHNRTARPIVEVKAEHEVRPIGRTYEAPVTEADISKIVEMLVMPFPEEQADEGPPIGGPDAARPIGLAEEDRQNCRSTPQATPDKPPNKHGRKPRLLDEREAHLAAQEEVANSKRFQYIVTSSGKFGIWDGSDARIVALFQSKDEAIEELTRLKTGRSFGASC
jgi:hypothetical protein